ncbi:caspase family protein [Janthinobacterium aquaticum]|uniref:caspase family protein n=1 Tax=Janthinobacterium sp. FT58W TaxID=2654254 RepID=UPI00186B1D61|nr:caspase family protein [Janthinobacterium sp. FT58W]
MSASLRALLPALLATLLCPLLAQGAQRHALLIGVSELPAMARSHWLPGPASDVAAMRAALLQQGFEADQIDTFSDQGQLPVRNAILARLAQLEKTLAPDDVLLLYWSGHSVLAPVYPGQAPAPMARRSMLLTRDSRVAGVSGRQRLENSISSVEIGRAIDAMSARQVQVLAVFDTCHAAAGTRAGDQLLWRGLAPADIGWSAPGQRANGAGAPVAGMRPRFVGFFAAEAQQRTPEARSTQPGQAAGLFTQAVIAALQKQPTSYASWAAGITEQYQAALGSFQLPRSAWPSPVYAGALDTPLWQSGSALLWPVRRLAQGWQLPYGLLDGVHNGDLFELAGVRWRAGGTGWNSTGLTLLAGDATLLKTTSWAVRKPLSVQAGNVDQRRLAELLALPASHGAALLDARVEVSVPGQPVRQLPLADASLGALPAGTRIRLSVENRGSGSVDLALAYLPQHGTAMRIYPALDGDSNRMPPAIGAGISRFERNFVITGPDFGVEWLALVAAPAVNGSLPRRFALLEQLHAATPTRGSDAGAIAAPELAQVARLSWTSVK